MKQICTLIFLFNLLGGIKAQNTFCAIDSAQIRIPEIAEVSYLKKTPEGGVVGVGYESDRTIPVIFKLSENKELQWARILESELDFSPTAATVDQNDGSIYLASANIIMKMSSSGIFMWAQEIKGDLEGYIARIHLTSEGNLLLLCNRITFQIEAENYAGSSIIFMDRNGRVIRHNTIADIHAVDLAPAAMGNEYFIVADDWLSANQETRLLKVDQFGRLLSARVIRFPGQVTTADSRPVVANDQGGVLVGLKGEVPGAGPFESILASFNGNLQVLWAKQWGMQPNISAGRNISGLKRSPQGGYLAFTNEQINRRVFLHHFDGAGRVDWTSSYYFQPYEESNEFEVFSDGRMAYSGSWSNGGFIVMADERGYAGACGEENARGIFADLTITTGALVLEEFDLSFFQEERGLGFQNIDLSVKFLCATEYPDLKLDVLSAVSCAEEVIITIEVCNNGFADLTKATTMTFYDKNPALEAAGLIAAVPFREEVKIDSCVRVAIRLSADQLSDPFFVLINNEGNNGEKINLEEQSFLFPQKECSYLNNLDSLIPPPIETFSLGPDLQVCQNETVNLSVSDRFARLRWEAGIPLDCDTCSSIRLEPMQGLTVYFSGETVGGCVLRDTIVIRIVEQKLIEQELVMCPGESVTIFGEQINQAGRYEQLFTTAAGCDSLHRVEVLAAEPYDLMVSTRSGCEGREDGRINVEAEGGMPPFSFYWPEILRTGPVVDRLIPGLSYFLEFRDGQGCRLDTLIELGPSDPLPVISFLNPGTIQLNEGSSFLVNAQVNGGSGNFSYYWSPEAGLSCSDCLRPQVTPSKSTTFVLTVTDENGCMAMDSLFIEVVKNREVFAPNIFSPNGDGINDYFYLMAGSASARIKSMRVFDRWGNLVFEKNEMMPNSAQEAWDGRYRGEELPAGIYVYVVEMAFEENEMISITGDVMLVR